VRIALFNQAPFNKTMMNAGIFPTLRLITIQITKLLAQYGVLGNLFNRVRSYAVAPGNAGILPAADKGVDAPNCVTSKSLFRFIIWIAKQSQIGLVGAVFNCIILVNPDLCG